MFKLFSGSRQYCSSSATWVETWTSFPQQATLFVVYRKFSTVLRPNRYTVLVLCIMCCMLWCNVSETAPLLTHSCWWNIYCGWRAAWNCAKQQQWEYTENIQSDGSNVERDKEGDGTEGSAVQGKVDGRKNKKLPLLHVQSIRIFHISLEQSGGKKDLLPWKGNYANFKSGPTIYQYENGRRTFTPLRYVRGVAVQLHSGLDLALKGGQCST